MAVQVQHYTKVWCDVCTNKINHYTKQFRWQQHTHILNGDRALAALEDIKPYFLLADGVGKGIRESVIMWGEGKLWLYGINL
jgi:hypothetical protein